MKIFSNNRKLIYKTKIIYKSGNCFTGWFSEFLINNEYVEWRASLTESQYNILYDVDYDNSLSVDSLCFDNYLIKHHLAYLNKDEIEFIEQEDIKFVHEFTDEFIDFIEETKSSFC